MTISQTNSHTVTNKFIVLAELLRLSYEVPHAQMPLFMAKQEQEKQLSQNMF